MSNDLTLFQDLGDSDTTALARVSQGGGFLPRLQLFGGSSDACKEGLIGIGRHGLTRGKGAIEDLGKDVEVYVLAGRTKAIEFGEQVLVYYEDQSPEFLRIQEEADAKVKDRMYGSEYLMWVPAAKSHATYFMASPTARQAAPSVANCIKHGAILSSELIDNGKHKWHGPTCKRVETITFEMPDFAEAKKQYDAFMNAKSSEVERVEETAERDR
jgi:hypothetical protein